MTTPSLDPIRLKMERVNEHAKELNGEIQAFYKTKPYEIVHEFDPDPKEPLPNVPNGAHLYRVVTHYPIPSRVPIIAGEVLRDMRSALDYVAWQLALAQSEAPPQTTAFPIFAKRKLYDRDYARFIGAIDPATYPVFESVQPYHAGDKAVEHPLWVLHRLANDDKHKVPHVVGSLPAGVRVERPPGVDLFLGMTIGPFEDNDVVATVGIIAGANPETQPNLGGAFAIAFGKDTPALGRHLTDEIDRIGREVDITITKFERFFP